MKCELCHRENTETTIHHLIPRERGGNYGPTAQFCIPCHKQVHALYTNDQLADLYYTIERLEHAEEMVRFLKWIKKQPATSLPKIYKSRNVRKK